MRVTNAQLAELEDIIEAKGLGLSLFERIRSENDGGFKYQQEYYQYVVRKNDGEYFISFVSWVGNRETVQYKESWARTKQYFESWINEIKTEIEAENKLNLRINSTKLKQFPQMILKFSPNFNIIYNQAYHAEQCGLDEICGLGYRKAFEFLIKDYLLKKQPKEEAKKIRESGIMQAINTYIQDEKLKILAHRTLWLGNDHAHYVKTWKNKSLNDLKGLIERGIEYIDTHEQYIIHQRKVGILEKDIVKIEKTMQSKKKKTKVL